MYLLNIEIVVYAIVGKVREVMIDLIEELPLTMVICGSRGLNTISTIIMGSVSTFLVHNSSVPVSVVRRTERKKRVIGCLTIARRLNEGVKNSKSKFDEYE